MFKKLCFKTSAFADDSNGRKTVALTFQYGVVNNDVPNCISNITQWMNEHFLKINPDKTEIILFHPKSLKNDVVIRGTTIEGQCIRFSREVKNVGVWLDENLDFDCHINRVTSHCYKLLKDIGRVRNVLKHEDTEKLVHAVISSRLDYCNSLYFNMSQENMYKLQKVQNAAARLIVKKGKSHPITRILHDLHWLRVDSRIVFKILLLVHKCIIGTCSNNLSVKYKSYNCRPGDYLLLETPRIKTKYGTRTFDFAAPRLWNALPLHIRVQEYTDMFKKLVKTMLFDGCDKFKRFAFRYN